MAFCFTDIFYELPLSNMNNETVNLQHFRGKRVMIVLLPLSSDDSLSITPAQITALAVQQKDSLVIIGVPGVEMGYTDANKGQVKALYAKEPSNFILASGMKVSKSSGQNQSVLFQWLTDITRNNFFDKDAQERGQKYFVNKYGHLYAVMGAHVKLSNPVMGKILSEHGH